MANHDPAAYGERVAEVYDDLYETQFDREGPVALLTEFAHAGRALELGIGTGRIALPLAAGGVEVHGIDASPAMVERLRGKPGGARIPVTIGDMAEAPVEGRFSLIYIVFNTLFLLTTQEEQVRCFGNVAARLAPDGVFLIEAFVPDLTRFTRGQNTSLAKMGRDQIVLDVTEHDPVGQRLMNQHVLVAEGGARLWPVEMRYAWPSELDLMARLAGLRLRHRWGGWRREPFTAASTNHISVYEKS